MALGKVEICGVNTAKLPLLEASQQTALFEQIKAGDEQVFHSDRSFQVCPYYHKAVQKTRKCTKGSSNFCGRIV